MNISAHAFASPTARDSVAREREPGRLPLLRRWWRNHDFLFAAYATFLALLFFTTKHRALDALLMGGLLPLTVIPSISSRLFRADGSIRVSLSISDRFYRHFDVFGSLLFCACLVYLGTLAIPGLFQPDVPPSLADKLVKRAVEIFVFIGVTAFLVAHYPKFVTRLFFLLGIAVAASAALNMLVYTCPLETATDGWSSCRFAPVFGLSPIATVAGQAYALTAVGAIGVALASRQAWWVRSIAVVAAIVLLVALVWTQTRGASAAAFAGIVVLALMMTMRRRAFAIAAVVLAIVAGSLLAPPQAREAILARGDSYRPELWAKYLAVARERPLLGYGQLTDTHVVLADGTRIDHPHNLLLSAEIVGGIFASGALLVIMVGGLYWTFRYQRQTGNPILLTVMTTMVVGGVTDFSLIISYPNWYWINFWLPIGLCIGSEVAVRNAMAETRPPVNFA